MVRRNLKDFIFILFFVHILILFTRRKCLKIYAVVCFDFSFFLLAKIIICDLINPSSGFRPTD